MNIDTKANRATLSIMLGISMLIGVVGGGALMSHIQANAQTPTATANTTVTQNPPDKNGVFKPNEDPAHEAAESPEREAQENAGQRPTVR